MAEEVVKYNPGIEFLGAFLTDYDQRKKIARGVKETLSTKIGSKMFEAIIRRNTNFEKATPKNQSIFEYESEKIRKPDNRKGRDDFLALAKEVLSRIAAHKAASKQGTTRRKRAANA